MKNVLITGVNGFVGPYLVEHLKQFDYQLFGMGYKPSSSLDDALSDMEMFWGDIRETEFINSTLNTVQPDAIIHLAGQSSVALSFKDPDLTFSINVAGTRCLLNGAKLLKKPVRVVLVSSSEVYGIPKNLPVQETHPTDPISPYGESRVQQEALCAEFPELSIVIARSFNHIGPKQPADRVCSSFAKQIIEIEKGLKPGLLKVGNLDVLRDFSDVRDIVDAYARLLTLDCKSGEVFNLCSGRAIEIRSVLDKFLAFVDQKIEVQIDPDRLRPSNIPKLYGSYDKLKAATGWEPKLALESTLENILNYWRDVL